MKKDVGVLLSMEQISEFLSTMTEMKAMLRVQGKQIDSMAMFLETNAQKAMAEAQGKVESLPTEENKDDKK